jgi:catechol 2,3-dioxygenase-like lactoylglutathione lyase family enzyme
MGPQQGPAQIAYVVNDLRTAARQMSERYGAGPFYLVERIELVSATHRGRPCGFVHSSAYGQWGQVMLELVKQDDDGPSPFRDLYEPGREGLHHLAFFVADLDQAIARYERDGMPLATRATTRGGVSFAFVDAAATLGHMIELYEPGETLLGFYGHVRAAAVGWDGRDPLRPLRATGD